MIHIYRVYPIECQPQWSANDNQPRAMVTHKHLITVRRIIFGIFAIEGVWVLLMQAGLL